MADVLIRNVPDDVLAQIRAAAAAREETLQARLSHILEEWTVHQRRHEALRRTEERLARRPTRELSRTEHERLLDATKAAVDRDRP